MRLNAQNLNAANNKKQLKKNEKDTLTLTVQKQNQKLRPNELPRNEQQPPMDGDNSTVAVTSDAAF